MGMLPGSVQLDLKWPIVVDGAELNTLTVRRPKARDQMTYAENFEKPNSQPVMLADLCEQTLETILDLDFEDYYALREVYTSFLPSSIQSAMRDSLI